MVELRPRRAKAAAPAEASKVEETPRAKPKTPKASKRKAIEDVSPTATKKAKSIKTPAESEDTEEPVTKEPAPTPKNKKGKTPIKAKDTSTKEAEETPAPKSSKKNKTPAQPKDTKTTVSQETTLSEEPEKTPVSKPKKNKTPAKSEFLENTVVQETTTVEEPEKTPAPKSSKKNKTPVKSTVTETVVTQEIEKLSASKAKKDKTPSKGTQEDAPSESDKTPAAKSKKDKTPAKAKIAKDTPSKATEQLKPKLDAKTPEKSQEKKTGPTPKSTKKTPKSAKKSESVEKDNVEHSKEEAASEEDDLVISDEDLDEQTKALIKTVDVEDVDGAESGVVLFEEGQDVGKIPKISNKQRKKAQKELAASSSKTKEDTGVIYIGRLPHGFYEHEMRSYFSQFGPIRNLRVSRNKLTGKPKHFAFIEFEEASTAAIVAKTMDNYLLFGHILKCSVIPKAQVHDELFKGANKRFKPVPWNKMEGKHMERPLIEDKWSRKIGKENKRRADRAKKLEALGYEFTAPQVKDVEAAKAIAAPQAEEQDLKVDESAVKAIEASAAASAAPPEDAEAEADVDAETIPRPAKRGRGRPPKSAAPETATPNKRAKRAKA
ncbi:nucleolar protein [Gnomoniopsis sp. IMI 355080]|nr:nucleolar protein [Gnomoniopsis sp. IMI 355080]